MSGHSSATVLVVDDERAIVDGHAARLESRYDVRTAYDGREAIEQLDDSVDVVLLDRRMPGLTGEEVLARVRDRDLRCRVAMLTGVEPSFDIIDMGFDDYLRKPISKEELLETVDRMVRRARYDDRLQEFFSLASKAAVLETEHDHVELERNSEYVALKAELSRLRESLDETLDELSTEERYLVAAGGSAERDRTDV